MNSKLENIQLGSILELQRCAYKQHPFPKYEQRIADLKKLKKLLLNHQEEFIDAMSEDFGHRCEDDSRVGDILTTISGINYSLSQLKSWMRPKRRSIGLLFQPASGKVLYQPVGVVGIITPWNYPLFLALGPLTAALAAGNRAMVKMSEYTPKTAQLLAQLISEVFEQSQIAIISGDASVAAEFSSLKFDHLFFTGSTSIGRLVMKAAAENLVPVTLELGGKSPSIIDGKIDIKTAVSRFILAKTLNSGQTCVAPDYILCPEDKVDELNTELKLQYKKMFPTILDNADCTSIINDAQYVRIQQMLADAESKGATVVPLSEEHQKNVNRQMPLTLVIDPKEDMKVLQEEIFGPILPIISYNNVHQVIDYINNNERPLALYVFSFDRQFQQNILLNTHSGGVCINDAAFHVANEDLPFGGIGASGMGSYHGEEGFKTFSHGKAILKRGKINLAPLLFPPYGKAIHKLIYRFFIR